MEHAPAVDLILVMSAWKLNNTHYSRSKEYSYVRRKMNQLTHMH